MRTIVDIPKEDLAILDAIAKREGVSRAELFRRMVAAERVKERERRLAAMEEMAKIFRNTPDAFDGLNSVEFQRKIRAEWDEWSDRIQSDMTRSRQKQTPRASRMELAEHPQRPYETDEK
jgi:chromatin segregation and condensation protein Rec8/ScpA/Scc1 (kleisin family)